MQRPSRLQPWVFLLIGLPTLIRGWIGLHEEPTKPVAFVSTAGGVMALAIGAISWWSLRKSKA